jgi:hypothetical protein
MISFRHVHWVGYFGLLYWNREAPGKEMIKGLNPTTENHLLLYPRILFSICIVF